MSLEVQVHKEIHAYQPKVMWGMSWRQLLVAAIGVPVVAGAYAAFWVLGWTDLGTWVVALLTAPFACVGWVRPKGLPFETYATYFFKSVFLEKQLLFYESTPVFASDVEVISDGNNVRESRAQAKAGRRTEQEERA